MKVIKSGITKYRNPYITVSCTNLSCDYHETLFGDDVFKYQPREVLNEWSLYDFKRKFKWTEEKMDYKNRIYLLLDKNSSPAKSLPVAIAPGIICSSFLMEKIRRNESDYIIQSFRYYNETIYFLLKSNRRLFISNDDLQATINLIHSAADSVRNSDSAK